MIELKVSNTRDGRTHRLELEDDGVSIHVIRQLLAAKTEIPPDDQIVLYGPPFARLDPRKPLYAYKLPSTDKKVFLYDRRDLSRAAQPPPSVTLHPMEIELPSSPPSTSSSSKLLSESCNPLMRALAEYEQQFLLHFKKAKALENGSRKRLEACAESIKQQEVQEQGVRAAISNLESFQRSISKRFETFFKSFERQAKRQEELLQTFDSDIEKLGTIELHPVLCTETRQVLLDCIPLEREKQWMQECQESHVHLKAKVDELFKFHESICDGVGLEITTTIFEKRQELKQELEHLERQCSLHEPYAKTTEDNYKTVASQIQEASDQMTSSQYDSASALEVCRGLDEIWHQQGDVVPNMEEFDQKLKEFMLKTAESKNRVNVYVYDHLRKVSSLQSQIRDISNTLSMLKEAATAQREQFSELDHLQQLPDSYTACLSEIVRRRMYGRMFSDKIQSMAEELAQLRENEMDQRESFLRHYGQHLPRDFVPGLAEKPSHCEFRMKPFDQSLPSIDDEDLLRKTNSPSSSGVSSSSGDWTNTSKRSSELELKKEGGLPMVLAMANAADMANLEDNKLQDAIRQVEEYKARIETLEVNTDRVTELEQTIATLTREIERKDDTLSKYQVDQQEAVMNAAAFEQDIQKCKAKEKQLTSSLMTLQQSNVDFISIIQHIVEKSDAPIQLEPNMRVSDELKSQLISLLDDREEILRLHLEIDAMKNTKISFRVFEVNDLALFLPTAAPGADDRVYLAFNIGCPHRYLSEESISSFLSTPENRSREFILGRIVYIDQHMANEEMNPFNLTIGTTYYKLTVATFTGDD